MDTRERRYFQREMQVRHACVWNRINKRNYFGKFHSVVVSHTCMWRILVHSFWMWTWMWLNNRKHLSCYIRVAFFKFFVVVVVKSEFSEANGFELAACVNSHDVGNLAVLELVKGDPWQKSCTGFDPTSAWSIAAVAMSHNWRLRTLDPAESPSAFVKKWWAPQPCFLRHHVWDWRHHFVCTAPPSASLLLCCFWQVSFLCM